MCNSAQYRPNLYILQCICAVESRYRCAAEKRNLATELSLWPGQSCGTVCQRQFVSGQFTLLNADSSRTFLACVLMIDSVMLFRSGFAHVGH